MWYVRHVYGTCLTFVQLCHSAENNEHLLHSPQRLLSMYLFNHPVTQIIFKMLLSTVDIRKCRKPRGPCQYTVEERKLLEPFKESYRSKSDKKARKHIWTSDILPVMFNYWSDNGRNEISQEDFDMRIRVSIASLHVIILIDCALGTGKMDC
jgi:hypothetical protein